jgi:hypothetical protein
MSEMQTKAHRHECAACGRRFSCSKAHTILDGGRFGLHPRCAGRLARIFPDSGPIRISLRPSRQPPPRVEPVTGNAAILARVIGRYGGPCALDVVAGAYQRELRTYALNHFMRSKEDLKRDQKDARDLVARLYAKELKRRGKGKWNAAAIAAMKRVAEQLGDVPFRDTRTVKTHLSRLRARERRRHGVTGTTFQSPPTG